jgi:hypothetical protein
MTVSFSGACRISKDILSERFHERSLVGLSHRYGAVPDPDSISFYRIDLLE